MQSGELEPLQTRDFCKGLAAQTTIHLRFVCPGSLIIVNGTCHAYIPMAYFLRRGFVFARILLETIDVVIRKAALRSHVQLLGACISPCLHA